MKNKINLAFVKYAGMGAGGVEKYLQTLSAHLPKDDFNIDFYYTDDTPLIGSNFIHPKTSEDRINYCKDNNVNLIKVECSARDDRRGNFSRWVDTNFFEIFNHNNYDLVQTGRGGYTEYPFNEMKNSLFVDSIHSQGNEGVELRDNIAKTILISKSQADQWVKNGGDAKKIEIIPTLVEVPPKKPSSLRSMLSLDDSVFIFGMHQATRESIFSPVPLEAYSKIENETNCFVILGGAEKYKQQAKELNLKRCYFLDFVANVEKINDFIEGIDVFAHGRYDGEVCSAAIIEALYHAKPCLSHPGINNGHFEQIQGCGIINNSIKEYANNMRELQLNADFYNFLSIESLKKWENDYNLFECVSKYESIYKSILN